MAKLKIAHIYPHGCKNAGDIYLIWAVKQMFEPADWIDINCKQIFEQSHINLINDCDAVIIGGGGLILPNPYNFDTPTGWQVGIPTELIANIVPPIIVYAIGWNLFRNQTPPDVLKENISEMIRQSAFFSLRHSGDIEKLEGLTGISDKITLNYCPSMIADSYRPCRTDRIAFQIASDRLETRVGSIPKFIANMKKVLDSFSGNKCIVAHTVGDMDFGESMAKHLNYEFISLLGEKPHVIRDFYYDIHTVFAMRGHGQMIPLGLGCKIVSIISHDKVKNLLEDLRIEKTGVEVQSPDFVNKCLSAYETAQKTDFYLRRKMVEKNVADNMRHIHSILTIST